MDAKFHKDKLVSFCQRCRNFITPNTETSRHKPKRAADFCKELQSVDGFDISSDTKEKDPIFLVVDAVLLNILRNQRIEMIEY